jgi:hypothetical protein
MPNPATRPADLADIGPSSAFGPTRRIWSLASAGRVISVDGNQAVGGMMGRASNRKKASRQAGCTRQTRRAMRLLEDGLRAIRQDATERGQREAAAARAWCGGREPVPAVVPAWPDGSLGDRFRNGFLDDARSAPWLATAQIPDAAVIAAGPEHWNVAIHALIRAVAFDGMAVDHPAVRTVLEALAPVAVAEFAYRAAADAWFSLDPADREGPEPQFPELEGPVFVLGTCALVDAVSAVVGEDPLTEVLAVLLPVLDRTIPGLNGQVIADALIGAFAHHYLCEFPGDAELLERIGPETGDVLENLVASGAVSSADTLNVGLMILSALAGFCRSSSSSVLQQAALDFIKARRLSIGIGQAGRHGPGLVADKRPGLRPVGHQRRDPHSRRGRRGDGRLDGHQRPGRRGAARRERPRHHDRRFRMGRRVYETGRGRRARPALRRRQRHVVHPRQGHRRRRRPIRPAGAVGSQNFSVASLDYNRELGILTRNPAVVTAISDTRWPRSSVTPMPSSCGPT